MFKLCIENKIKWINCAFCINSRLIHSINLTFWWHSNRSVIRWIGLWSAIPPKGTLIRLCWLRSWREQICQLKHSPSLLPNAERIFWIFIVWNWMGFRLNFDALFAAGWRLACRRRWLPMFKVIWPHCVGAVMHFTVHVKENN